MGLKSKIKNALMASPRLNDFYYNAKVNGSARLDAFFHSSSPDEILIMSYQYYLSRLVPRFLEVSAELKAVINKIKYHYDEAIKYAEATPTLKKFVDPKSEWGENAQRCKAVLAGTDYPQTMATLGARAYKNFEMLKVSGFNVPAYRQVVSNVLNILFALQAKYKFSDIRYQGFSDLFYPHFYWKGNIFNTALYDLETRLYVSSRIKSLQVIAEIGGGDGAMCKEFMQQENSKYIIFDIPEILIRSHLFLTRFFREKKRIGGFADYLTYGCSLKETIKHFDILCLPYWVAEEGDLNIDLWLATHVFGEMSVEIAQRYMQIINRTGKHFLSVNDNFERVSEKLVLHRSDQYLGRLSDMTLVDTDFPISSNFPRVNPYYARHLFVKK